MTGRRVETTDGVCLNVVVTGRPPQSAPSIVVLHGFTGDAASMEGVAEALEDERCVIRIELVGHGGSDSPRRSECYSMAACVQQVQSVIRTLGIERPYLLGYSMGGRVALSLAARDASELSGLILVGATAGIADETARNERIRSDEELAERVESEGIERFVEAWMALPLFASQARLGATARERARKQRLANSVTGLAGSLRGMGAGAQPPVHAQLSSIECPVLLVVGDEDEKFKTIARDLEARLPNAAVRVLPEAGHAAHLEAPDAFRLAVRSFLVERDGKRACPATEER